MYFEILFQLQKMLYESFVYFRIRYLAYLFSCRMPLEDVERIEKRKFITFSGFVHTLISLHCSRLTRAFSYNYLFLFHNLEKHKKDWEKKLLYKSMKRLIFHFSLAIVLICLLSSLTSSDIVSKLQWVYILNDNRKLQRQCINSVY